MWYTCGDSRIALRCQDIASKLTLRRGKKLLQDLRGQEGHRDDFFECMFLLRVHRELGSHDQHGDGKAQMDQLLDKATEIWDAKHLYRTEELYGVGADQLRGKRGHPDYYCASLCSCVTTALLASLPARS